MNSRPKLPPHQTMDYDVPSQKEIEDSTNNVYEESVLYSPTPMETPSILWSLDCWSLFKKFKQQLTPANTHHTALYPQKNQGKN